MSLLTEIKNELKEAMLAKDAVRVSVIRNISASTMNEAIAKGKPELTDEEALTVIKRLVKQRRDSIEQFEKGNRKDLADAERSELAVLEKYLPKMMSRDDIRKIAVMKKSELGIADKSKAGQFTGMLMKELKGKADGGDVKAVVDEILS